MKISYVKNVIVKLMLTIILSPFLLADAQNEQMQFEHLLAEEGPVQNLITTIYQDKEGFLWFGTQDGLYLYNGYGFTAFQNRAFDTLSISGNYIQAITEDTNGNIWIGTQSGGVSKYNKILGTFTNYRHSSNNNSLINNRVWSLLEDSKGCIWIGTSRGLDHLNPETNRFIHFVHDEKNLNSLSNNSVNSIYEDKRGTLWVGTFGGGLCKLNLNTFYSNNNKADFENIKFNEYKNPGLNRIKTIIDDNEQNLWLATFGGLLQFNKRTKEYKVFLLKKTTSTGLNENTLLTIVKDKSGQLWGGSHDWGLCQFDKKTGNFKFYNETSFYKNNLSDNYISSLYVDRTGILWIGTGKGIDKLLPYHQNFINLSNDPFDSASLSSDEINSIYEDSKNNIWLGTWEGGLNKLNLKNFAIKRISFNKADQINVPDNTVWAITERPDKNLLIGTYSGLYMLDRKTKTLKKTDFRYSKLSHQNISTIVYDHLGDLWIGTFGGGLNRIKRNENYIRYYKFNPQSKESISDNFITCLFEDKEGNLWIGTHAGGLNLFNREKDSFSHFQYNPDNKLSLNNNNIRCIAQDKKGNLWIGTWGGGINLFDKNNKKFIHYTEQEGLPDNVVLGIQEDNEGNLWISTNNGLSKFDVNKKTFLNYYEEDGLLSNQFSYGYLKTKEGFMLFGATNGLTIFKPENIQINDKIPPVVITAFKKSYKEINFRKELLDNKKITLDHDDDEFTIDFASLDYTRPAKNNFAYKLEGYDKEWIYSRNIHSAHYTNLYPGEYTFRVKATNNDGIWNEKGTALLIEIVPPFYNTVWFKSLIVIVIIVLVYLLFRYRVKSIAVRNEILEKLVRERTLKLEEEINIRENTEKALIESEKKLKIINANKDKFFSIISHDLKSPFFSLLGYGSIIETDFDEYSKEELKTIIGKMNLLIRRLSDLTENLLQWSKIQTGRIDFKLENTTLGEIFEKPLTLLKLSAENKDISIINKTDKNLKVRVDVNMINSVIQNLIVNSIKFTKSGGQIVVTSSMKDGFAEISISDTGVGIDEKNLDRLFKIEEQFSTAGTNEEKGSGLGLILCKEFVEKNGGKIWAESINGNGTTFKFTVLLAE